MKTEERRPEGTGERLQKILAAAGIASRRQAEELILAGRVVVNGKAVTQLGSKADASSDHIRVDGRPLKPPGRHRYFMLNKPKGVITSASDPEGRPTVMSFFARSGVRVFPVGRLDYQSEGLLLMTNDGELANSLISARSRVEKTYLVKVSGKPTASELEQLRHGVMVEKGSRDRREGRIMTRPARIRVFREAENPWYEVVLVEGKNREIRKMFEEIGHFVEKIRRIGFGPLHLDLKPGELRELTGQEVALLKRDAARSGPKAAVKTIPRKASQKTPSQQIARRQDVSERSRRARIFI